MKNERYRFEHLISHWLMHLREEKGLSQEALGIQLGKGQSDIAKIESASKRVSVIELISWMAALDIPCKRIEEIIAPIYNEIVNKNLWDKSS